MLDFLAEQLRELYSEPECAGHQEYLVYNEVIKTNHIRRP